ncbi:hypothetical protein KY289_032947 [Solanum tuberosum]|nr:hypothetical protein KY289_032947 [Solanum tuberosum]
MTGPGPASRFLNRGGPTRSPCQSYPLLNTHTMMIFLHLTGDGSATLKERKGVVIVEKVVPPRTVHCKPPQVSSKGKKEVVINTSSHYRLGIDSVYLTYSGSKNEEV